MTGERTYPVLPCADLDETLAFYVALGFAVSFKQYRPNPYAVVTREDLSIHLTGIDGFDPANSYGSAIITVDDPDAIHSAFTSGLRQALGKVPRKGIPRVLPPRRKAGTSTGFTVVDPGGNWLRFFRSQVLGSDLDERRTGLARVIDVAARQGDARGVEIQAIAVLDAGITRHNADASPTVMLEALLYRAELCARMGGEKLHDAARDVATAAALIARHDLGPAAEASLIQTRDLLSPE